MAASHSAVSLKLFENLQSDLKSLSVEAKKKHPPVKEASEACMLKLRMISQKSPELLADLLSSSSEIIQPFIMGCDSKNAKMAHISLTAMQRMIQHETISATSADNIIKTLWNLLNSGVEELKLLQTIILMITTNSIVQHESLSKAMVLGFRLYFTKDSTTINTAGATVRQLVTVVYDRVVAEDRIPSQQPLETFSKEKLRTPNKTAPESLRPCAQDGFLLFQDLCQLVNADNPLWLVGITEMTRTFGLELLESVMSGYPQLFINHPEYGYLLKERVCPLVIKLFSPSLKFRQVLPSTTTPNPAERPYFPIVMRLLRIVQSLIKNFYSLLSTECEIFLSLLVKFMDVEKPMWQRCIALEVVHRLCSDAKLVRSFVETYDMKEHSAKIFQDIVNAIGSFIQTLFMQAISTHSQARDTSKPSMDTQGSSPALVGGLPIGGGITPQPAFIYKNIWIPLIMNVPQSPIKPLLLEMMDKLDVPSLPEGYGLSLGFSTLLEISSAIETNILQTVSDTGTRGTRPEDKPLHLALVQSSWCALLASLSLLLETSTDEQATQAILKVQRSYVHLSGILDMKTTRDAFVTALCKAALPTHYGMLIFNQSSNSAMSSGSKPLGEKGHERTPSADIKQLEDIYEKSQVVALTAKNISCMKAILYLTICHGSVLGSSWNMVLTTLQHLAWILGLKSVSAGQLKVDKTASADNTNAIITTAIMSELPEISHMLSRLFESSQYLDDVAIHHLIDALCKLSNESMEIAYNNREPSLFAVAKIHETALVNLHRVDVLWKPLTAHLIEVCQHPHVGMRLCGADAITSLVSAALQHTYDPPLHSNKRLLATLLSPLKDISLILHPDVRQKQLECALNILQNGGDTLASGWPAILQIIGDGANIQSETLVRTAFQSMQLVVTDFLMLISPDCLTLCVQTAAMFSFQQSELNVSLTAIGLLWNISDFFYLQREKISQDIQNDSETSLTSTDELWMCLYSKFGELCVDSRPAVRKSAGQTLFSTIAAHGDLLQTKTWKNLLWMVLFPLLDNVKRNLDHAPSEREKSGPQANILMHHSRDTARKQWSETQVLIMAGVSRVFSSRKSLLEQLDDFARAWAFLLQYIEKAALGSSAEVALAALKSFLELISDSGDASANTPNVKNHSTSDVQTAWRTAWKVWLSIGNQRTCSPASGDTVNVPSQTFLCHLIQIFPKMFSHVQDLFVSEMFEDFTTVLSQSLAVPISGDTSPFLVPTNYESSLTPAQEHVTSAYQCLCQNMNSIPFSEKLYPKLIDHLIRTSEFAIRPPQYGAVEVKPPNSVRGLTTGYISSDLTEFAEKCMEMATEVYCKVPHLHTVITDETLKNIVLSLYVPLSSKYQCACSSTWRLAIKCLIQCLKTGLAHARTTEGMKHSEDLWPALSKTLYDFCFPKHGAREDQSLSEFKQDEQYDCMVVDLIGSDILPHSDQLPKDFITSLVQLLNKGSINSQPNSGDGGVISGKVRTVFTQKCFDVLLVFSFANKDDADAKSSPVSQVAICTLVSRCVDLVKTYSNSLQLSNNVPAPRSEVNDVSSAIRVIGTMVSSLRKLTGKSVDKKVWDDILGVYPELVGCVTSKCEPILTELQTTLLEYRHLLALPSQQSQASQLTNGSS